jgi:hypothetical protein
MASAKREYQRAGKVAQRHAAGGRDRMDRRPTVFDGVGQLRGGARPAEFPIQRPIYLSFLINMRTAKLLHLAIPASLSALADEVIE